MNELIICNSCRGTKDAMNSVLGTAGSSGTASGAKKGDKAILTKNLILKEYKQRLRDSVKSLNDNFQKIASAGKVGLRARSLSTTYQLTYMEML